jgi:MSHA biogenesis protein MshN
VEPPVVPSATSTAAAPPPSVPAPAARATIERIATVVDPLDAARVALAEGRADAALAALAVQPEAGAERDALEAAALQQLGRHAEAEQAYRRALRREPDVGAWWAGLGISLDTSGRGDEALDAFREAQRRGPLDPALADYLGERVEALSAGEPSR